MSLDPNKSTFDSKPRVNPTVGKHVIRNYGIIDIGTQEESFQGKPPMKTPKVILMFEFPKSLHVFDEKKGPEPLEVFQEYSFIASDRSKLCKVLKVWGNLKESPKQLNLKKYLGKYCEVDIELKPSKKHPDVIYANIADGGRSVFRCQETFTDPTGKVHILMDQQTRIPIGCKAFNQDVWFDLDNFSWAQFVELPKFIQDKIRKCLEFPGILQKYGAEPQAQPTTTGQPQAHNYSAQAPATTHYAMPTNMAGIQQHDGEVDF